MKPTSTTRQISQLSSSTTSLKHIWLLGLLVIAFLLPILLQHQQQIGPTPAEAKITKKLLKKAKKYAWLLAPQRQKFYAIPFPFPLPVFVKRQHIYTQVPIVPRYVQQPHHGSSSEYGAASSYNSDTYASMSSPMPDISSFYSPSAGQTSSSGGQGHRSMSKLTQTKSPVFKSGGYLAQIASAIGHNYNPASLGSRDLVTKLLSGQAKIISPAALLANLKPTSSASPSSSSSSSYSALFDDDDGNNNSYDSQSKKNQEAGGANDEDQSNGGHQSNRTSSGQHQSGSSMKQSASEMLYSVPRRPIPRMHPYMSNNLMQMGGFRYAGSPRHHPMMMMPSYAPFAGPRFSAPIIPIPYGAGDYSGQLSNELLPMNENQLLNEGSDMLEAHATSVRPLFLAKQLRARQPAAPVEATQTSAGAATAAASASQPEEEENELATLRKQAEQEHLVEAVQRLRFEAALVAARERQVVEANAAALTAHQMGLPLAPASLRLVNY